MQQAHADALRRGLRATQKNAERYELQELSAVPDREIENFCPRTAVNQQTLERVDARAHHVPGEFPPASEAARLYREAAPRP